MHSDHFQEKIEAYAELAVKTGLNLQPGQRLLIRSSLLYGVPHTAAPLVRAVARQAYAAGARFVDVLWGDEEMELIRFQSAPRDSFEEASNWRADCGYEFASRGDAILTLIGINPNLLKGQDPELVSQFTNTGWKKIDPLLQLTLKNEVNWLVIAVPTPGWSAMVFPGIGVEASQVKLWETLFQLVRLNNPDPVEAWKRHVDALQGRAQFLNTKQYQAFHYRAQGTDLTLGLPEHHIWAAAGEKTTKDIPFIANLPTEEVFTLPHRAKADGIVRASLPLNYSGTLIEEFEMKFENGRVVGSSAKAGEVVLKRMLETDEGASRLGEIALVPHSSPISQTGTLFYNTLLDENASCHLAVGSAYKANLKDALDLDNHSFAELGGNNSLIHVDFMIGSSTMDIDGITADGKREPVFRSGEWAFDV